ncbi:hypothetical protein LOZ65_006831 [Ophidiomyces ophidiicola]|nr:hypothetical protein LOZ65_006831 [Ophidiomyces ophidiicola]
MPANPDKRTTVLDLTRLESQLSFPPEPAPPARSDDSRQPLRGPQARDNNKRKAPPAQVYSKKFLKGTPKDLVLPQIVEYELRPPIVREESPWETFHNEFTCELAGTVTIAVHRSRPSRVVPIRAYATKDAEKMLERFGKIQHKNVISVIECYKHKDTLYAVVDDLPLTLVQLVACRAYPSESQLASIVAQVLDGLSYLAASGFEHESMTCSNILLGLDGLVKIGSLEFCVKIPPNRPQTRSIKALSIITMELMQKYEKEDGLIGVDDLDRWPIDSSAVDFLIATSSASSIDELKQVSPTSLFLYSTSDSVSPLSSTHS